MGAHNSVVGADQGFALHPGTRNRYEIRYTRTQLGLFGMAAARVWRGGRGSYVADLRVHSMRSIMGSSACAGINYRRSWCISSKIVEISRVLEG